MKERPILFNAEMVSAILQGRKTQTRRVAKNIVRVDGGIPCRPANNEWGDEVAKCPYGKIGGRLWVREAWAAIGRPLSECTGPEDVIYRASANEAQYAIYAFKPSIHMPRWASRITLKIASIRVERLQEISEQDALAEGIYQCGPGNLYWTGAPHPVKGHQKCMITPLDGFRDLWDSINASRGFGWLENPYVYVICFERVE